jgi:serine/threonine protein kinase
MVGEKIGNYLVDGKLGEGGMGIVYSARHELIGKRVAIKVLRPQHSTNEEHVERFFREAKATTRLNHPGTVDILDTGKLDDGRAYLVMALLEGEDLKQRLQRDRPSLPWSLAVTRQIAELLSVAHDKGIIHRDLKPDNIFVVGDSLDASGVRIKVLDFGVAKLVDEASLVKTKTVAIIGTPPYMSPEQCRGAGFVSLHSDIYAVGCILYELICGRTPFVCRGFGEYLIAHCVDPVPPPSTLVPTIDPGLERVIMKALSKTVAERHQSMNELLADLDTVGKTPSVGPTLAATAAASATLVSSAPLASKDLRPPPLASTDLRPPPPAPAPPPGREAPPVAAPRAPQTTAPSVQPPSAGAPKKSVVPAIVALAIMAIVAISVAVLLLR